MANVRPLLKDIWEALRQASVVDDLAIVEYIAALLIEMVDRPWPFDEKMRPKRPRIRYNANDDLIRSRLTDAVEQILKQSLLEAKDEAIARLFNQDILFFPAEYRERDSYPTPRHIIDFMLSILDIKYEHSFADLASGSGGFLIQRENVSIVAKGKKKGQTVGVDISGEWTRIAMANVFFHRQEQAIQLYADSAFHFVSRQDKALNTTFDRIALSPPLQTMIDTEAQTGAQLNRYSDETNQVSDVAFVKLLLAQLSATGKGSIIVSSIIMEQEKRTNKKMVLREELIDTQVLRAVITLENGVDMPKLPAYLLCLDKNIKTKKDFVWFCQAEKDGYPAQARDFTQDPSQRFEENDLLFLRSVLHLSGKENDFLPKENDKYLGQHKIYWNYACQGIVIKPYPGIRILKIDYDNAYNLRVVVSTQQGGREDVYINLRVQNQYIPALSKRTQTSTLFEDGDEDQLIAISSNYRILGMTKSLQKIRDVNYTLLPAAYFGQHDPPLEILSEQREAYRKPVKKALPQIATHTTSLLQLFNQQQWDVWSLIEKQYILNNHALYFTPDSIQKEFPQVDIMYTLKLLEHMGLIKRVFVLPRGASYPVQVYRRIHLNEVIGSDQSSGFVMGDQVEK